MRCFVLIISSLELASSSVPTLMSEGFPVNHLHRSRHHLLSSLLLDVLGFDVGGGDGYSRYADVLVFIMVPGVPIPVRCNCCGDGNTPSVTCGAQGRHRRCLLGRPCWSTWISYFLFAGGGLVESPAAPTALGSDPFGFFSCFFDCAFLSFFALTHFTRM